MIRIVAGLFTRWGSSCASSVSKIVHNETLNTQQF
jgi:hypothetical protein